MPRKPMDIAIGIEPTRENRIFIELINGPFFV
jgi:hypothetical protein